MGRLEHATCPGLRVLDLGAQGGEDCPVAEIDRQSGVQRDGVAGITAISPGTQRGADQGFGGQGGASRYFNRFRIAYYAKASDRSVPGSDDPKANRHETHKHPELMRWLVRLLARPGNVVLDCFMGSGTTGVACAAEGISFIGIEREPRHFAVAQARIEHAYRTMAVQLDLFAR